MKARTVSSQKAKKQRRRTVIYLYMLFILLSLFVGVSYTWFTLSRNPRVSNMNVYITSAPGLEFSVDKEEWVLQLDFWDIVNAEAPLNEEREKPVLRPVTWSEENQCFYAAAYGVDGRLKNYRDWHVLTDERNANKQNIENYYIKATFFVRSGQPADVTLSPAVEVNEGVDGSGTYVRGVPIWNPGYYVIEKDRYGNEKEVLVGYGHDNGGQGAENAIRLGFKLTSLIKDEETGEYKENPEKEKDFLIFEPNCDYHADGSWGYVPTESMDGTETLVDPEKLILQTATTWTEADPIEKGVVIHTLGELIDPQTLFSISTNEIIQIELYVWLEGQDMDCLNQSRDAQIQANLQFAGTGEAQSGLVEIE